MIQEGHSEFLIYMTFNAWIGVQDQHRKAALVQLANELCFGPDYTINTTSSTNHRGNSWDPGQYEINHIEAVVKCSGEQADLVAAQRRQNEAAVEQRRLQQSRAEDEEARIKAEQESRALAASQTARENTCKSFGFKPKTQFFSSCLLELYKLEQQIRQHQLLIVEQRDGNRQQQAAQLEALFLQRQALDQQRFSEGIQQMQKAAEILNPPRTTISCKWNALTSTMLCE